MKTLSRKFAKSNAQIVEQHSAAILQAVILQKKGADAHALDYFMAADLYSQLGEKNTSTQNVKDAVAHALNTLPNKIISQDPEGAQAKRIEQTVEAYNALKALMNDQSGQPQELAIYHAATALIEAGADRQTAMACEDVHAFAKDQINKRMSDLNKISTRHKTPLLG